MPKTLITGGSGLIGQRLTELLLLKGYSINHLGRNNTGKEQKARISTNTKRFVWDVEKGEIDAQAFEGVSSIIHLAGTGVAEKRWTDSRKKEIIESRVKSAEVIRGFLKKGNHSVKTFVSAAAVGYYGDCGDEIIEETHKPGTDFLAEACKKWEQAAIEIANTGLREVRCRIGIVLAKNGGALPNLTQTIQLGFANYFSKSNLYYPWVHIDDVCGIFIHAVENENMNGAYNTTAPVPLLIKDLMKEILKAKKSNAMLLPAPPFALKIALGELSEMILSSDRCSAEKVMKAGFRFKFGDIGTALENIFLVN